VLVVIVGPAGEDPVAVMVARPLDWQGELKVIWVAVVYSAWFSSTMETCKLVLPPADRDAEETASTPDWKLVPVPLPIASVSVGPVPPPLLPPLDEPDSSRIELEVPPQAASSTVMVIPAMIDNLRMSQHPSRGERPALTINDG
jgi:hypothetical protein